MRGLVEKPRICDVDSSYTSLCDIVMIFPGQAMETVSSINI